MFGVLVVDDGAVLAAFSGMLDGRWHVDGFVGPAFDSGARDSFWPAGEAELGQLEAAIRALDPERDRIAAELARAEAELDALRVRHRERREARRSRRGDPSLADVLDHESRGDTAERKRFDAAHRPVRDQLLARAKQIADEQARLAAVRADRSRHFLHRLQDTYAFPLRALFAPHEPPGGAGDCAAPKLVAHALRHGMRPRAIAEFWWGPPPPTGDRVHGTFYPACRGKCLPILSHLLDGIAEPPPVWEQPRGELRTLFEDAHVIVASKPVGLLSAPGRSTRDSVQTRLGATAVHRLDLDTSGVLLLAKDPATLAALHRQFENREVDKRYIAWLAGDVAGDAGTISLPLRGDLDDRPRQIVDDAHGRPALTEWRVLAREGGRTRVAFTPKTGRAHQLRVHAAHPRGLATPIVGDRLYGASGARLMLHAEFLAFVHPHTRQRMELADLSPF
ncbi:MAG: RluA family pseudouridine synthase [Deltaproteobacteria bacterium]|nr:RluA family pseudouridine synthase [Deltaproteobacteria bacterium]